MPCPRPFNFLPTLAFCAFAIQVLTALAENGETASSYHQQRNVVYHDDVHGVAVVMDIFTPKGKPNGLAVIDVVSGSWFSDRGKMRDHERAGFFQDFCSRGYTVFAARPGSQSKFTGEEMLANVKRAIRWVKHHAKEYNIDPDRLGISGASAGGHLASLAAVTADEGSLKAKDPIDRENSRVHAAAVFFPPTDFVAWPAGRLIAKTRMAGLFFDGGRVHNVSEEELMDALRRISPALHVTSSAPPFLIYHGTKDVVVPLRQSQILLKALQDAGVEAELRIKEGGGHPWPTINEEVTLMGDWFDQKLKK